MVGFFGIHVRVRPSLKRTMYYRKTLSAGLGLLHKACSASDNESADLLSIMKVNVQCLNNRIFNHLYIENDQNYTSCLDTLPLNSGGEGHLFKGRHFFYNFR